MYWPVQLSFLDYHFGNMGYRILISTYIRQKRFDSLSKKYFSKPCVIDFTRCLHGVFSVICLLYHMRVID